MNLPELIAVDVGDVDASNGKPYRLDLNTNTLK